ncbi:MAG: hypothetical protein M3220_18070 [Chloroflexota bacterium]|nr:hypothetical protein [Chloroflexota bacterium]
MTVTASFRALADRLIDYAGMFPPANLPLEEAVRNYARYQTSPEQWMLSRFILPIGRLSDLDGDLMALFSPKQPLHLSLLVADLQEDLYAFLAFRERHGDRTTADFLETRFPAEGDVAETVKRGVEQLAEMGIEASPFFELPFNEEWDDRLEGAIQAIADANEAQRRSFGFKLRCGGTEPEQFPSPTQVARALLLCRDAGVPLKCTAGLHHPFRHFSEDVGTTMHGFINIFGGGVLAHVHDLDESSLRPIIEDEEDERFRFSDQMFVWGDLAASPDAISDVRQNALISFGSCSFDEPREDLRALELIDH